MYQSFSFKRFHSFGKKLFSLLTSFPLSSSGAWRFWPRGAHARFYIRVQVYPKPDWRFGTGYLREVPNTPVSLPRLSACNLHTVIRQIPVNVESGKLHWNKPKYVSNRVVVIVRALESTGMTEMSCVAQPLSFGQLLGELVIVIFVEFLCKLILTTFQEKQFFFFKNKDCFNINYLYKVYPNVD